MTGRGNEGDDAAADGGDGAAGDSRTGDGSGDGGETRTGDGDGADGETRTDDDLPELVEELLDGDHRALARTITKIENREPGYRELVSALYDHTGDAAVVGVTGSPGAGKSTLVDRLAKAYRDRGETVGVIAVDPSSPYSGGAVLGDRIRMASNVGDMDVFFRSMSTRGHLGGLSTATGDAVKALDAFGKDRILVETVGAGQSEVEVVETADTVAVLVPPASGDDVQMLKAGILEIGDVFVVNKADLAGADRTVQELRHMLELRDDQGRQARTAAGHHGADAMDAGPAGGHDGPADSHDGPDGRAGGDGGGGHSGDGHADGEDADEEPATWEPSIVETVANQGEGVEELLGVFDDHRRYLETSGELADRERARVADEIRTLLRDDVGALVERELDRRGGVDEFVEAVLARETDPYRIADEVVEPLADCLDENSG